MPLSSRGGSGPPGICTLFPVPESPSLHCPQCCLQNSAPALWGTHRHSTPAAHVHAAHLCCGDFSMQSDWAFSRAEARPSASYKEPGTNQAFDKALRKERANE
ncbi:hypothetical protein H1C71_035071 [Ictidomys tridecemlineatus]|nr:hypothetical protein H1C71_035071 [Ictidomys tridecemlineatus]KAG3267541.1 hypothetical protein H1C71_035071 [Ictidomys tridecemlineatus]KAG3267542.1 hypothetical protein H1C71_035071 [Ictidomys tridecemlineatus]KAG3267543.1 hypothetical protein H1C71_035071 [Ictidomys tridecemlineatus]